jgi:hypothetical protein
MDRTDVTFARKLMERELLRGATPKIGYRGPGRTPSIKGADFGPAGKYLEKYFDEQRRNKARESYTDFQDYRPPPAPPTNYSYLNNPTWGG